MFYDVVRNHRCDKCNKCQYNAECSNILHSHGKFEHEGKFKQFYWKTYLIGLAFVIITITSSGLTIDLHSVYNY